MRVWVRLVAKAFCCAQVVKALSALYLEGQLSILWPSHDNNSVRYMYITHRTIGLRIPASEKQNVQSVLTTCSTIQVLVHCSVVQQHRRTTLQAAAAAANRPLPAVCNLPTAHTSACADQLKPEPQPIVQLVVRLLVLDHILVNHLCPSPILLIHPLIVLLLTAMLVRIR